MTQFFPTDSNSGYTVKVQTRPNVGIIELARVLEPTDNRHVEFRTVKITSTPVTFTVYKTDPYFTSIDSELYRAKNAGLLDVISLTTIA